VPERKETNLLHPHWNASHPGRIPADPGRGWWPAVDPHRPRACVAIVAIRLPPRRRRVPAPAPDLAPQSFGRYVNGNFQASVLLGGLSLLLAGTAFLIARKFGGLVFVTVFYGLLALSGLLFRDTWVAGGDGWLVLLRGREQLAWVRTGRRRRP